MKNFGLLAEDVFSFVLAVFIFIAIWCYFSPESIPIPDDVVEQHSPIARTGEWITHPDGSRACRLTRDIYYRQVLQVSDCTDWTMPVPFTGQQVDFLRWSPARGQINVEGEWRP
jgi:hypothetical protein